MLLRPVDFVVIIAYFTALIAIGVYFSRRQTSREEYFLGGRRINWFLAGTSVLATLLSSVSYLAVPGEMIRHGIGLFTEFVGLIVIIPVVLVFIIPTLMRLPDASVYDYFERRYNRPTKILASTIFVVMRLIWIGLVLYTCCKAVAAMTGWSLPVLALVVASITVIYTTLGGIAAVVWTDLMQLAVLAGGAIAVPLYVLYRTGAGPVTWWSIFSEAERAQVPVMSFDPTVRITAVGAILSLAVWQICTHSADQIAAQRYLCTPSVGAARRSFWCFSIGNVTMIGVLVLCGLAIFYFEFQRQSAPVGEFQKAVAAQGDQVFPRFIATELPTGLSGLLLAGILAAAMSSLSSGMNSVAAVLGSLTERLFAKDRNNQHSMVIPLVNTVAVGVVGIAVALLVELLARVFDWNLVTLFNRMNHLFVAPLGAMFLGGVWFRRIGAAANLVGLVCGVVASFLISFSGLLFGYDISFTWIMPASFVVSVLSALAASALLPSPNQELRSVAQAEVA